MAQCIFVGATRICSASPYRVNGQPARRFPKLSKAMRKARRPAHEVIDTLEIPDEQKELAKDLMDAVLATNWGQNETANAGDIHKSVRLMLVNAVGKMNGKYTLVAY